MKTHLPLLLYILVIGVMHAVMIQSFASSHISNPSKACIACHKFKNPSIYEQWGSSKHYRAQVACFECHAAEEEDEDAFEHYGQWIATIVSPRDCARCHEHEVAEFSQSRHAKAGRILGSLDNTLAEVVEGNRDFITPGFPHGNSAAAVSGCWQCHGSQIRVLSNGRMDPATWPNTGIGRIHPDGSEGACSACHSRHEFSAAQARMPETCGKCHRGPDHPHMEIFNSSKHGITYNSNIKDMALHNEKWVLGEDYNASATCATCHMSATKNQAITHDVGLRISWNNRAAISVRPEVADAKLGLPGKDIAWQVRRENMIDVCIHCHNRNFVDAFYIQYDALLDLYHDKFAKPGLEFYNAAQALLHKPKFRNKLDFIWFELWHHEGRRARHGASMMSPDYTHWYGMYEVSRNFYTQYIPELRSLIHHHRHSENVTKKAAAQALDKLIDTTLAHDNHKWFLGQKDETNFED